MKRLLSIDILRTVAILLMIQTHFVENLSPHPKAAERLYEGSQFLGRWPAPLFTFLVGLSLSLWMARQTALGRSEADLVKMTVRRGLLIFGAGLAFSFFVWLPKSVFDWDILTLIGAALVVLAAVRKLSPGVLASLAGVVLLASPPLRGWSDYASHWEGGYYSARLSLAEALLGFALNGYFPLFPWILFPLLGFATGEHFFKGADDRRRKGGTLPLLGIAVIVLCGLGAGLRSHTPAWIARYYATGMTFYPASTTYLLGVLGLNLVCLWVLHRWVDRDLEAVKVGPVQSFFRRYSYFSFTVYLVHHAVHVWPLWIVAAIRGCKNITCYEQNAMSAPMALSLSLAFIVLFYGVLIFLERRNKFSFEHLVRWLCE